MYPIKVENLSFAYNEARPILKNLSFNIEEQKIVSILGPNGSGKTTLLKSLLGLLTPSEGKISIFGEPLSSLSLKERARKLAYVPQKHKAVFAYKVLEVVAMGKLPYSGVFCTTTQAHYDEAEQILEKMGLSYLKDRHYNEISGGEQQLAMICRALLQEAEILVLDEPVTGLDYGNQLMLLKKLKELSAAGVTCVMTTHYPEHALWTSTHSIFLKNGQLVAEGETENIINTDMLYELYNAQIRVLNTEINQVNIATCVPIF